MDSRIFILLQDRIQYIISFLVPVVPLLATGGFFSLLSHIPLAGIYPLLCVFVLWFISLFSIYLLSGTTTCSRLIYFLHTFQNLSFLQEGLFFRLENGIRNQDMDAGILVATEMWLLWGFLDWQWKKKICWYLSVVVDQLLCAALQTHGLQHARFPCPSSSPRVCSNSCPWHWWCHPTIFSVDLFSSCPKSFPASGSLPVTRLFASGGQSIGASAPESVLPVSI